MFRALCGVSLALFLAAGCASSKPAMKISAPSQWQAGAQSFTLALPEPNTPANQNAAQAVRLELIQQGWRENAGDDSWQIQVSYAERSAQSGLYTDQTARHELWQEAPRSFAFWQRGRHHYSLMLKLDRSGDTSGPHIAQGTMTGRPGKTDIILPDLAQSVVKSLTVQPSASPVTSAQTAEAR